MLFVALLIGGYVGLKTWADNSAKDYALSIDSYFDKIFEKKTRGERVNMMKERVTLAPVPLGSFVSPSYKNAEQNLKPQYEDSMVIILDATISARDLYESVQTYLDALKDSISYELPESHTDQDEAVGRLKDIESLIALNQEVADKLDAATDDFEKATSLKQFPSYESSISKARDWATARRQIAGLQLFWFKDLIDNSSQAYSTIIAMYQDIYGGELSDKEIVDKYKTTSDIPRLNYAEYNAKDTELRDNYRIAAFAALDEFGKLVDEIKASTLATEVQAKLDTANSKFAEIKEKLLEFATEEELQQN